MARPVMWLAVVILVVAAAAAATAAGTVHKQPVLPASLDTILAQIPTDPAQLNSMSKDVINATLHAIWDEVKQMPQMAEFLDVLLQLEEIAKGVDKNATALDPDCFRTHCESATVRGYSCEEHTVKTEDGYLIDIFRIYRGAPGRRPPVLLSHGLLDTSYSWIYNEPSQGLGYILADAGYDVWLGNVRGNTHGLNHERWGQFDKEFWDFSFDHQGKYDVPATIAYIREQANVSALAVVGHSQGCTQLFSAVQQHPSLADSISLFVALAPAGYFDYLTNFIIEFAAAMRLADLLEALGVDKFLYLPDFVEDAIPYVCHAAPELVESLLSLVMGSNPGEINLERLEVGCAHSLGFTSMRNMVHWSQLVRDEVLHFFDYGYWGNRDVYGSVGAPPKYTINQSWPASVPVAVFYGGHDDLVTSRDAEDMINDIPASALVLRKFIDPYAHLDFMWGKTANVQVYNETLSLLRAYLHP